LPESCTCLKTRLVQSSSMAVGSRKCSCFNQSGADLNIMYIFKNLFQNKLSVDVYK
jgi:hypothetical protein